MAGLEQITRFLDTYGVLGIFVIATLALWRKWLIPGWVLTDATLELKRQLTESEARCAEIKAERDELLRFHFRGLKVFSKVVAGREIKPRPGIVPDVDPDDEE
jgi:hypothetical protein